MSPRKKKNRAARSAGLSTPPAVVATPTRGTVASSEGAKPEGTKPEQPADRLESGPEVTGPEVTGPEVTGPEVTGPEVDTDLIAEPGSEASPPAGEAGPHETAASAPEPDRHVGQRVGAGQEPAHDGDAAAPAPAEQTTDRAPGELEPDLAASRSERGRELDDETRPYPGAVAPAATPQRAWRRLGLAARPRATKANVLATLLAVGLGFAIAAQVRQTSIEGLEDLREDELIRILDTVDQDGNRLAEEIQTLRFSRDRLQSDTTSLTESRAAAQQRLDSLAILTGTAPARGPGIVLTIRDPEFGVTAPMLLDTLQELRDAGAEAVEINDVRIVANTYFTDGEGSISISGRPVSAPYVITAIGDGSTLASAMEIPGGVTNTVRSVGGEAGVETKDEVTVSALQRVSEPQYARPIPSPTSS